MCARKHNVAKCTETRDTLPIYYNCEGAHIANCRGCTYFVKFTPTIPNKPSTTTTNLPTQPRLTFSHHHRPTFVPNKQPLIKLTQKQTYASATKNELDINTAQILEPLTSQLFAIATNQDHKFILKTTIKSILILLSPVLKCVT